MTKFFMLFLQKKCKSGDFYKKNRPEERLLGALAIGRWLLAIGHCPH